MKTIYRVSKVNKLQIEEKKVIKDSESSYWYEKGMERKKSQYHNTFETKEDAVKFIGMQLIKRENYLKQQLKELESTIKEYETLYKL